MKSAILAFLELMIVASMVTAVASEPRWMRQLTMPSPDRRLMVAGFTGDEPAFLQALADGASPKAVDELGDSALAYTVQGGKLALVDQLLMAGADVNVANEFGITPLMLAVAVERPDVAKVLLKHGADAHTRSDSGLTALQLAQIISADNCVKLLSDVEDEAPESFDP